MDSRILASASSLFFKENFEEDSRHRKRRIDEEDKMRQQEV